MMTVEQAKQTGAFNLFTSDPDFVISAKSDLEAEANIMEMMKIKDLLNDNFSISDYSDKLKNLTLTYLILKPDNKGVQWKERRYHKRSEQKYFIDIRFPDFYAFCNADKNEALKIMAQQTIRATRKFLEKEKHFDYEKFYEDFCKLMYNKGILEQNDIDPEM